MTERDRRADWFRLRTADFAHLDALENSLADFARRELDALIIRGVYPADYMREISACVARHDPPFYVFPPYGPAGVAKKFTHLYGITLVAGGQDLDVYFEVARSFRAHCRELFRDGVDFEERVRQIFGVLSGGRPVRLAPAAEGRFYMPATIRILPEGAGIDLHCDNNLSHHPAYDHLRTVCDVDNQLSYFLTINTPERGGELVVYRRRWSAEDDAPSEFVMKKQESLVEGCERLALKPEPGDMILHAGGRAYHRVTESDGGTRHTIGGFVADALDADTLYYWS